jgi:hypothetical protein
MVAKDIQRAADKSRSHGTDSQVNLCVCGLGGELQRGTREDLAIGGCQAASYLIWATNTQDTGHNTGPHLTYNLFAEFPFPWLRCDPANMYAVEEESRMRRRHTTFVSSA